VTAVSLMKSRRSIAQSGYLAIWLFGYLVIELINPVTR
jgi:hypothetical protein